MDKKPLNEVDEENAENDKLKNVMRSAYFSLILKAFLTLFVMVAIYWLIDFLFAASLIKIGPVKLVLILKAAYVASSLILVYVYCSSISRKLLVNRLRLSSIILRCVVVLLFGFLFIVENSLVQCCVEYLKIVIKSSKISWLKPYNSADYVKNIVLIILSIHVILFIKSIYNAISGLSSK
jgi:hypothetical protein